MKKYLAIVLTALLASCLSKSATDPKSANDTPNASSLENINSNSIPDVMVCLGDCGVNPRLFPTVFYGACIQNAEVLNFEQVIDDEKV
ncbi:MAG: hypothetical protein IJ693_04535 [Bacteroidaceae bacterium]|nr:hypothetical protein [Bacteroidaceae bacterium]